MFSVANFLINFKNIGVWNKRTKTKKLNNDNVTNYSDVLSDFLEQM